MVSMLNIENWWGTLSSTEQIFWGIAVVFSVLAFIQFVLSLFGLDFDGEIDNRYELTRSTEEEEIEKQSTFSLFSARNTILFFAFFGWTGVLMIQKGNPLGTASLVAAMVGFLSMLGIGYVLYWFSKLSKGENPDFNEILFTTAEVRTTIPADRHGHGKIRFYHGKNLREMDAVTEHITSLPTGSKVRIVDVVEQEFCLVEPFG